MYEVYYQSLFGIVCLLVKASMSAAAQQRNCNSPLGMENRKIQDNQIRAKSWLYFDKRDSRYYRPYFARLNYNEPSGGWCSADFAQHPGQYIEVDLLENTLVTAIATQGRHDGQEWVQHFEIEYQRNNETRFRKYEEKGTMKVFQGNTDINSTLKNKFSRRIILRKIRIIPLGTTFTIYCMRLELYGCKWNPSRDGLISYSAPLGGLAKRKSLQDNTYDGFSPKKRSDLTFGGLGKLTDGIIGSTWLVDYSKDSYSSPWIGYTRNPVIIFIFNSQRRLNSIILHVINHNRSIRLFNTLKVEVSADGVNYKVIARYVPSKQQKESSGALAITVPLKKQLGSYLRCSFDLKGVLFLLSEVEFDTADPAYVKTKAVVSTQLPSDKVIIKTKDSRENKNENSFLAEESKTTSSSEGLSFPIILTIVLVGIVMLAGLVAVLVRYLKSVRKSKTKHRSERFQNQAISSTELHEEEKMTLNGSRYVEQIIT